jgi:hypothetical protein
MTSLIVANKSLDTVLDVYFVPVLFLTLVEQVNLRFHVVEFL